MPVLGLLVLGVFSIRMKTSWESETEQAETVYLDKNTKEEIVYHYVHTDSKVVNTWLLAQSLAYLQAE
jgi:hypothetical protein